DLTMIGLDRVAGLMGRDVLAAWTAAGGQLGTIGQATARETAALHERGEAIVIDVRGAAEWTEGHAPGVPNIPVGYLAEHAGELPPDRPVILYCQSGSRSAIA